MHTTKYKINNQQGPTVYYKELYSIFLFLKDFFLMWTIFKVFIEFVTILYLFLFYVLVFWPRGMWDLSSSTRDRTLTLCTGRQGLNHWTREVPQYSVVTYMGKESGDFPDKKIRLHAPSTGGPGSIPGQGTRSHMHAAIKSSHATTKELTCHN